MVRNFIAANLRDHTLLIPLAVSILLRGLFLFSDLPHQNGPDEGLFLDKAIRLLSAKTLDPGWYGAPASITIYSTAFVCVILFGILWSLGIVHSAEDFRNLFQQNEAVFFGAGRIVSLAFGVGTVALTYFVARRLGSRRAGMFAALALALCLTHIEFSRTIRMDVPMTFFVVGAAWGSLKILESGDLRSYLISGAFVGMAATNKYPGVVAAVLVIYAHILRWRTAPFLRLVAAGCASVAAAFLTAPFVFIRFSRTLHDVAYESRNYHPGHTGGPFLTNLTWYLTDVLPKLLPHAGWVLIAVGLVAFVVMRRPISFVGIPLTFLVIFTCFVSSLGLLWVHWLLPVAPFAAILVGCVADRLMDAVPRLRLGVLALLILTYATAAWPVLLYLRECSTSSTTVQAQRWILSNLPEGSRLLLVQSPALPFSRYRFTRVITDKGIEFNEDGIDVAALGLRAEEYAPDGGLQYKGSLANVFAFLVWNEIKEPPSYLVIGDLDRRISSEPKRFGKLITAMKARTELVWEVVPKSGQTRGPHFKVYRLLR